MACPLLPQMNWSWWSHHPPNLFWWGKSYCKYNLTSPASSNNITYCQCLPLSTLLCLALGMSPLSASCELTHSRSLDECSYDIYRILWKRCTFYHVIDFRLRTWTLFRLSLCPDPPTQTAIFKTILFCSNWYHLFEETHHTLTPELSVATSKGAWM